ncbi:MAG: phage portal protein [Coriobacteriaceae bacterium]|nr:phage portal protein [Coriobacteriaceae bacterium]
MGIRQRIVDWLGNVIGDAGAANAQGTADAAEACVWMEQARQVMASYVISALQLCDVRFYGQDGETELSDQAWLWNVSPNPNQSRAELMADLLGRLLADDGRAVVVPVRTGSRTSIYVADSGTDPEVRPGMPALYRSLSVEGSTEVVGGPLASSDVYAFDMRGVGGGWHELRRQVDGAYDRLAAAIIGSTKDRAGRKWVMRLGRDPAGTAEQQAAIEQQVRIATREFVRSDDGVMPLYKGQELERASADVSKTAGQVSSDVTGIRRDMYALVAACLHMPASLLDGNVNNFESTMGAFLTFGVDPVARMLSEEITRKTYTASQWARGARATVDTTHIRHVDIFQVADAAAKLVGATVDSPNEIRRFTGQDPIPEPWADEYQMTKNNESAAGGESDA